MLAQTLASANSSMKNDIKRTVTQQFDTKSGTISGTNSIQHSMGTLESPNSPKKVVKVLSGFHKRTKTQQYKNEVFSRLSALDKES